MANDIKVNNDDVEKILLREMASHHLIASNDPYVVFITGVSGSGKSTIIKGLKGNFLKIQSDNYRKLHPKIKTYQVKLGRDQAYKKTGNYSFEFAKALRNKAIEHRLSVIYEATFSKIETAKDLITPFLENHYRIIVVRLPVDIELSIQRNRSRYEEKQAQEHTIPRMASREDIEKMANNYVLTLNEISKQGIKVIDKSALDDLLRDLST